MKKPLIAVTLGDPGGIGPEIILKSLKKLGPPRGFRLLVTGAEAPFRDAARACGLPFSLPFIRSVDQIPQAASVSFLEVGRDKAAYRKGQVCKANAALALASLKVCTDLAVSGQAAAVVTAPLHKTAMRLLMPGFTGHTEYLAARAKCRRYAMMFVGSRLKVTLVTIHVALKDVSRQVTRQGVLNKILLTHDFLQKRMGLKAPRLGICALNPHGEETGDEEPRAIAPAVAAARRRGIKAFGPFSADQLFFEAYSGHYDALISMYHDQALAPFKMVSFRDGVNVTLGLPFVRTSPDHGTAFDIAYRGRADALSMTESIRLAALWTRR